MSPPICCFRLRCSLIVFFALALALTAEPVPRRYVDPRSNVGDSRAFSSAVWVGETLYVSGHLGLGPDRRPPADPADEARLVLDHVKATMTAAGLTMDDLVFVQVHCTDLSLYGLFNDIYRGYFTREFPARAFLGTSQLLFGTRFEILGVATKRPPE